MTSTTTTRGGAWLIEETAPKDCFTRERLTDEHRLIASTADEFMISEVMPALDRLEQKDWALARTLVRRSGERRGEVQQDGVAALHVAGAAAVEHVALTPRRHVVGDRHGVDQACAARDLGLCAHPAAVRYCRGHHGGCGGAAEPHGAVGLYV